MIFERAPKAGKCIILPRVHGDANCPGKYLNLEIENFN